MPLLELDQPEQLDLFEDPHQKMMEQLFEQLIQPRPELKRLMQHLDRLDARRARYHANKAKKPRAFKGRARETLEVQE